MNRRSLLVGALSLAALAPSADPAQAQIQARDEGLADGSLKVTPALGVYISGSQTAVLPDAIRELARLHILDTLAAIVACRDLVPAKLARAFAASQSGGARRNAATMLGVGERAGIADAVFASAMTAHLGAARAREAVKVAGNVDALKSGRRLAKLIAS